MTTETAMNWKASAGLAHTAARRAQLLRDADEIAADLRELTFAAQAAAAADDASPQVMRAITRELRRCNKAIGQILDELEAMPEANSFGLDAARAYRRAIDPDEP